MKLLIIFFVGFLFATGVFAQSNSYLTSPDGLKYKILTKGKGRKIMKGDIVEMDMTYKTEKDSLLFNSSDFKQPITIMVDKRAFKGDIIDGLLLLSLGDSAQFLLNADSLFERTFQTTVPDYIRKGSLLNFFVKITGVQTAEELAAKTKNAEKESIGKQELDIQTYLKANKLSPLKTSTGLYYVVTKNGTGELPKQGQTLTVHYTGKLLNGTKFDSSVDRNEPFQFQLGGGVIKGWNEGFALFNKGTKATLIIPYQLGYGAQGAGADIKPYSPLVFDVELIDFK